MSSTSRFTNCSSMVVRRENEAGITLVLFAMVIVVVVMIVSLVVDLGKQELALTQIRQASDAAALSAARQLNGRPDGWRASKIAGVMVLKRYPIHGVHPEWQDGIVLSEGYPAFWDENPPAGPPYDVSPPLVNIGTEGAAGGYHIRVERGMIRSKLENGNESEFVSLENVSNGQIMSGAAYLFANAVRVEVSLDSLPGIFTRIFNSVGFSNLRAHSYGVMDGAMQRLVAPIAISFDDLMLDTNPQTRSATHQTPWFIPELSEGREVEIGVLNKTGRSDMLSETPLLDNDPFGQVSPRSFIDEGLTRFRSFIRLPYAKFYSASDRPGFPPDICYRGEFTGAAPNCKSIPIEGYFAIPGVQNVTAEMVVKALESGGVTGRVGNLVSGLMNLGPLATDHSLASRLAAVINGGETTFAQYFMDPNGTPRPNYPFLRTTRLGVGNPPGGGEIQDPQFRPAYVGESNSDDLIISYPTKEPPAEGETEAAKQRFIMGEMSAQAPGNPPVAPVYSQYSGVGHLNFINPMCHFDNIPINNPAVNRVKEVYAMVVAPRKGVTESGRPINFRDFAAMFAGAPQDAIAEVAETLPTIVGFVRIGLFDGNTLALNARFNVAGLPPPGNEDVTLRTSTPVYGSGSSYVVDDNPAYIDLSDTTFKKDVESYSGKVDESYKCYDKPSNSGCSHPGPPPNLETIANLLQCFDFSQLKNDYPDVFDDIANFEVTPCCISSEDQCGIDGAEVCPGCVTGGGCCTRSCYGGTGSTKIVDKFLKALKAVLNDPIRANPDTHCLYNLLPDSEDMNNLDSYAPLHPLTAGFGCGGLRGRLRSFDRRTAFRNDDHVSLVSGMQWSRQSPSLVNVDE